MSYLVYLTVVGIICKATTAKEVTIDSSGEQSFGRNNTLHCTFIKRSDEVLISVTFLARNFTKGTYQSLVSFRPITNNAAVTDFGDYLSITTSTEITQTSTEASIMLNNISCLHQRGYRCQVVVLLSDGFTPESTKSKTLNVSVEVPPTRPQNILLMIKTNEISTIANINTTVPSTSETLKNGDFLFSNTTLTEGDIVSFLCSGIVGNPTRNYLWQRIDQSGHVTDYTNASTTFQQISGECYYSGTSEFTYAVTAEDNKSKMRCFVENMTELNSTTAPLTVHYRVRKPTITKHPDQYIYGKETTSLILNCLADGNPQPFILWTKNGEILGNMNVFEIKNLTTNESGIYECLANNAIRNKQYIEFSFVNITVVEEIVTTTPAFTEKPTHSEPVTETSKDKGNSKTSVIVGAVFGAAVVMIGSAVAIVIVLKKLKSKRKKEKTTRMNEYVNTAMNRNSNNYERANNVSPEQQYDQLFQNNEYHVYTTIDG